MIRFLTRLAAVVPLLVMFAGPLAEDAHAQRGRFRRPVYVPTPAPQPVYGPVQISPLERFERMGGWDANAVAEARAQVGHELPRFSLPRDRWLDTTEKVIRLWTFERRVNGGKDLDNVPQLIGDCVGAGYAHACETASAVYIAKHPNQRIRRVFRPYLYGTGRVQCGGGKLRGDGSCGAWQSCALRKYGANASDEPGMPEYSATLARQWGAQGPPQKWIDIGQRYLAECELIETWDDLVQAIAQGRGVAFCSSAGFEIVEADGRIEGRWRKTWNHCMACKGIDTRRGKQAAYIYNSWGEEAHAKIERYKALGNDPPGGFWVLRADIERMLAARDTYSVEFKGFQTRRSLFHFQSWSPDHDLESRPTCVCDDDCRCLVCSGVRCGIACGTQAPILSTVCGQFPHGRHPGRSCETPLHARAVGRTFGRRSRRWSGESVSRLRPGTSRGDAWQVWSSRAVRVLPTSHRRRAREGAIHG